MSNNPTAKALQFNITAGNGTTYEVAIFADVIFAGWEYGFRTVYRKVGDTGDWIYLAQPSIYKEDGDTVEALVTKLRSVFDSLNAKIKEFFRLSSDTPVPVPEDLFEKLEYILSNEVVWDGAKQELVYTPS